MKNRSYAYMAGILDGEGCLGIYASHYKPGYFRTYKKRNSEISTRRVSLRPLYGCRIQVTNCDRRLMDWIVDRFGGTVHNNGRREGIAKTAWKWLLCGHKAQEKLLLGVLPYLVLKREQALILLEFIRMNGEYDPAKRQVFVDRLKILNRRGVPQEANTPTASKEVMIESVPVGDNGSAITVM
jgi:hypothetical protein